MQTKVEKYWPNIYNVYYILLYVHLPSLDCKALKVVNYPHSLTHCLTPNMGFINIR